MKNCDQLLKINRKPNWLYVPIDHPYRIIGSSGKTNALQNLIKHQQPYIDKIYLYVKDPFKSK